MAKQIPKEQLVQLWNQLNELSPKDKLRSKLIKQYVDTFGVSRSSVYRQLSVLSPINNKRSDAGINRITEQKELIEYCRIISALKIRTSNEKGTHMSTQRCINILEEQGIEIDGKFIKPTKGLLRRSTIDRYLNQWQLSYDHINGLQPVVRHFEATFSNECWQFDFTPSDLKHLPGTDKKLYLGVAVDDTSGVVYAEYFETQGEDAITALKFLYNAISIKPSSFKNSLCGIPYNIYTDNGPFAKSKLYQRVLNSLGITLIKHMPKGSDNRRVTARSKGKIEKANQTIKSCFETGFHLQAPKNIEQANQWLHTFLDNYNQQNHRRIKNKPKITVWKEHLPEAGYREGCSWEQFCNITREPEIRKVLSDACISIQGERYQLSPNFAGLEVTLLFGTFDNQVYVEYEGKKAGPFYPEAAPSVFLDYNSTHTTDREKLADEIYLLSAGLSVTNSLSNSDSNIIEFNEERIKSVPFKEDKHILSNKLEAKKFIANYLGKSLSELSSNYLSYINDILEETLDSEVIIYRLKQYTFIKYDSQEIKA